MSNVLVDADPKRDFKAVMAWWKDMAQQNGKCTLKTDDFSSQCFSTGKKDVVVQRGGIFQTFLILMYSAPSFQNLSRHRISMVLSSNS